MMLSSGDMKRRKGVRFSTSKQTQVEVDLQHAENNNLLSRILIWTPPPSLSDNPSELTPPTLR